jgi:hypothetical protein
LSIHAVFTSSPVVSANCLATARAASDIGEFAFDLGETLRADRT